MFAQSKLDQNVMHSKKTTELRSHSKVQLNVDFMRFMKVKKSLCYCGVSIGNSLPESFQKVNDKKMLIKYSKFKHFQLSVLTPGGIPHEK